MDVVVKEEISDLVELREKNPISDLSEPVPIIDLSSSSDSESDLDDEGFFSSWMKRSRVSEDENGSNKKQKHDDLGVVLPLGFLDLLPPDDPLPVPEKALPLPEPISQVAESNVAIIQGCKQFWKAGDYGGSVNDQSTPFTAGMDHVRVHPKFLHSNATSHKWALGAFAELLDNSLDEVINGATFVNIDMLENKKDKSKMLFIEDNGGGMDPDKMRQCMSLGYSAKSKIANTIGQYGNGFKTSTMRLGADVIVFSRCHGKDGKSSTQSIGMLSYTFLRSTGKEDIVVPMLDYMKEEKAWNKLIRSSSVDWNRNVETIVQWSPYSSEADLLQQFNSMEDQGTRIIIYNLWEDDQGHLELDFGADRHDIQIRGVNRDERKIQMAKQFPNTRHFMTYRHSLRSYASILYLRLPRGFRMILRGKDIEHHNVIRDMMLKQEITYRPQPGGDGVPKDPNMVAVVTIGFVKDAKDHIDIQGFNVYHKNRLIKPFWRVWNAAGSGGRGVIGVLEANFVEPAHDKQGFERTTVLSRLETRLIQMQKTYWGTYSHKIGYAARPNKKVIDEDSAKETSPEVPETSSRNLKNSTSASRVTPLASRPQVSSQPRVTPLASRLQVSSQPPDTDRCHTRLHYKHFQVGDNLGVGSSKMGYMKHLNGHVSTGAENGKAVSKFGKKIRSSPQSMLNERSPSAEDESGHENHYRPPRSPVNECGGHNMSTSQTPPQKDSSRAPPPSSPVLGVIEKEQHPTSGTDQTAKVTHVNPPSSLHLDDNGKEQNSTEGTGQMDKRTQMKAAGGTCNGNGSSRGNSDRYGPTLKRLEEENLELKLRLKKSEESTSLSLQFENDRNKSLEAKIHDLERKLEDANKEQEALIDIFSEERNRRDKEEENLRKKLKEASATIQELLEKSTLNSNNARPEH
ncbi:protein MICRORCHIDIA 7-like [Tasmannia lanceolata]|uniref:protein MICRORCHIDIA 7-like n=1 Tax=Tasmannia lanceolata TaxID=3420 RepID=UPI0040631542